MSAARVLSPMFRMSVSIEPWAVRGCAYCEDTGRVTDDEAELGDIFDKLVECPDCSGTCTQHCQAEGCAAPVHYRVSSGRGYRRSEQRVCCKDREHMHEVMDVVMEAADREARDVAAFVHSGGRAS